MTVVVSFTLTNADAARVQAAFATPIPSLYGSCAFPLAPIDAKQWITQAVTQYVQLWEQRQSQNTALAILAATPYTPIVPS